MAMQVKDNQINIIRIKLDGSIISEFYHPDIITKSVKTATKGKSLPIDIWEEIDYYTWAGSIIAGSEIRSQGGRTYLVTVKE